MPNMLYMLGFIVVIVCLCIQWSHMGIVVLILTSLHLAIGVCFMIDPRAFAFEGDYFKLFFAGVIDPTLVVISLIVWLFCNFAVWWEIK